MCIPHEYWLDGQVDCLDWSDEIPSFDDRECSRELASDRCDDRWCPPSRWPCGDGQCIEHRFEFQRAIQTTFSCVNRRNQYFLCESHYVDHLWTLPNGRCYQGENYTEHTDIVRSSEEYCRYLLRCNLAERVESNCPCWDTFTCAPFFDQNCTEEYIRYPRAPIIGPSIFSLYHRSRNSTQYEPDALLINGTFKCGDTRVSLAARLLAFTLNRTDIERQVCPPTMNKSPSCSWRDACAAASQCRSDGSVRERSINCSHEREGREVKVSDLSCEKFHRSRFRCGQDEGICVSVAALGDSQIQCPNRFDESWRNTSRKLVDIRCNREVNDECRLVREYIEDSWSTNRVHQGSVQDEELRIPFRSYCDTFWNLLSGEDENIDECQRSWHCLSAQWQCHTGQCIDQRWLLDGQWDCVDGSDEHFDWIVSSSNHSFDRSLLEHRLTQVKRTSAFSHICDLNRQFPCFLRDKSSSSLSSTSDDVFTSDRVCLNRSRIGDGHVDCHGAIDELARVNHCHQSSVLGYHFKCPSSDQCIPYLQHCSMFRCSNVTDDRVWCERRDHHHSLECDGLYSVVCFNGTCAKNGRCNNIIDCFHGEDELMCEQQNSSTTLGEPYRKSKQMAAKEVRLVMDLMRFPSHANVSERNESVLSSSLSVDGERLPSNEQPLNELFYRCNRGLGVKMFDGSVACFCPAQYAGDRCQLHTDRVSVLLHLDLSHSTYGSSNDPAMVIKLLVLLLWHNETIGNHVFHVRPASEFTGNRRPREKKKKMIHFPFSRSSSFREDRLGNRSLILDQHAYSIRIETYERKPTDEPSLIAVWQYALTFDHLPVSRLAKVLRLPGTRHPHNPCSLDPCNGNEDCQPLINEPRRYLCLCRSHYTGPNCSLRDERCARGYCAPGSVCKASYRGHLLGNARPLCICPFSRFGDRCSMQSDRCVTGACENNGSCFVTSQPESVFCLCSEHFYGSKCQWRKAQMQLTINGTVDHTAVVVQLLSIDFRSLNLVAVHQEVRRVLPPVINYEYENRILPELVLIKVYSSPSVAHRPQIYLLSLHLNVNWLQGTSQLTTRNLCSPLSALESRALPRNASPMSYHAVCQTHGQVLCFLAHSYVCVCNEKTRAVECFGYDTNSDRCSRCQDGGRCLHGDQRQEIDFVCLCPRCRSGSHCQFDSNSFSFTLDQLFFTDLQSSKSQRRTIVLLVVVPVFLFIVALPNNVCSLFTFRRQCSRGNSIGQYLFWLSAINQLNLSFLVARLLHLIVHVTRRTHLEPVLDDHLCRLLHYLLSSSSQMIQWLSSLVAIERLYMTLVIPGRWLSQASVARRLLGVTLVVNLLSKTPDLFFVQSSSSINEASPGMCVFRYPVRHRSLWLYIHLCLSTINSLGPVLINMCSMVIITCVVTKKKINTRRTDVRTLNVDRVVVGDRGWTWTWTRCVAGLCLLVDVLREKRELIIAPAITLIPQLFSLPLFISSLTLYCQHLETSSIRYFLIGSYLISFVPQLISFVLYVSPSTYYSREWRHTSVAQWIYRWFHWHRPVPSTSTELATVT